MEMIGGLALACHDWEWSQLAIIKFIGGVHGLDVTPQQPDIVTWLELRCSDRTSLGMMRIIMVHLCQHLFHI